MCFSPSISIGASFLLLSLGLKSWMRKSSSAYNLLCGVPFIFAIQQAAEAVVWWGSRGLVNHCISQTAVLIFLLTAFGIWPWYIPLSVYSIERTAIPVTPLRRASLLLLTIVGVLLAAHLIWSLLTHGFGAVTADCHIVYTTMIGLPYNELLKTPIWYPLGIYSLTTIVPFFIPTQKKLWVVGTAMIISCLASLLIWNIAFVSVWCFFAAIISMLIVWVV